MKKCESCGKVFPETKDVFCPYCGAVANTKCTHGSLFETDRYDRGELCRKNEERENMYARDAEPHIQRETKGKISDGDFGNTVGGILKKLAASGKTLQTGKANGSKKISAVITVVIVAVIIVADLASGIVSFNDNINYTEDYSEVELNPNTVIEASAGETDVELLNDAYGTKTFKLTIGGLYLNEDENRCEAIVKELNESDTFAELVVNVFPDTEVSGDEYVDLDINSEYLNSFFSSDIGSYDYACNFEYGEIVDIGGELTLFMGDESCINIELPFSAFSVCEDGTVTYYKYEEGNQYDSVSFFEECDNRPVVDEYSLYIKF